MRDLAITTIMAVESLTHWSGLRRAMTITGTFAALAGAVVLRVSVGAVMERTKLEHRQLVADLNNLNLDAASQSGRLEQLLSPAQLEVWADLHGMVPVEQDNVWRLP